MQIMNKFTLLAMLFYASVGFAQKYQLTGNGLKASVGGTDVELQFYNASTVRVLKSPQGRSFEKKSLAVTEVPEKVRISVKENGNSVRLKTSGVEVVFDMETGVVGFFDAGGKLLVSEQGRPSFKDFNDAGNKTFSVRQSFRLDKDEPVYGLGILQNGKMSQRGQTKRMVQGNVEDYIPFIQSVKGYGIYWDNYSPTDFIDAGEETAFRSEVGDCIDYYFMYGGNADGVVAKMRRLTGDVPMIPLWAYGYMQSKERYKSQDEIVGVLRKYRELNVPIDCVIQDWQYWGHNYLWNAMDFQNPLFRNPKKMMDDIHGMNARVMISIWSSFGPATRPYRELAGKGMLFDFGTWPQSGIDSWPPDRNYPSGVRVYDAYNPEARDIYWKYLNDGVFKFGIDGWWMDSTEPDHLDFKPEDFDTKTYMGSFRKVRNAYPLMTVGGVYDHQRAATSDKRVMILTRSVFAGQQRYGANVWSGDVGSSWETLRKQVPAGLNFTLAGNPNYNSDIGGFFCGHYNKSYADGGAPRNPMFQELYVRWLQFSAFNPMMRSHGADAPREIYQFGKKGEPVYDAIEKAIRLRYSLLPYIYSTSWDVSRRRGSFMRALVMDFADDRNVWDMNDEYMFGRSILVAPVLEAHYTPEVAVKVNENDGWDRDRKKVENAVKADFTKSHHSKVYLPAGTVWYDFWTNERHDGGREISKTTKLDVIPLYVKAGSIVPIGPDVQYSAEKAWDNLELRVYTGADGEFVIYEDEFDNYNYEKGEYTEIPVSWSNASRRLTIGRRKGAYKGMIQKRKFTIVTQDGVRKTVSYDGRKVSVRL
ncbi:TIM-barrel domain-containing protein [Xylanibacter muris]|uniref:DUF5110 domain-containing protein n=1 Tax=Xylanibacter muris TaxID=2736290 RepID=A0ABX2AL61_9BACT|nr:TIM-barrel domain-containing protein [Xylanibacter muris]NPD91794.1 DUF5110 domain-containing protein [Xylanibacter muris]